MFIHPLYSRVSLQLVLGTRVLLSIPSRSKSDKKRSPASSSRISVSGHNSIPSVVFESQGQRDLDRRRVLILVANVS